VFSKDSGGDENYQFYRYDVASGAITLLTDGKSRNLPGTWSNNGELLAYGSTRRNGQDVDIWIMNPRERGSERMLAQMQGGGWSAIDFSPDDRKTAGGGICFDQRSYLWLIDVESGERKLITPRGERKIAYGGAQFRRMERGIYLTTDRDSEFQQLAYFDLAKGTLYLPHETYTVGCDGVSVFLGWKTNGLSGKRGWIWRVAFVGRRIGKRTAGAETASGRGFGN
jgi:hypothetical protein